VGVHGHNLPEISHHRSSYRGYQPTITEAYHHSYAEEPITHPMELAILFVEAIRPVAEQPVVAEVVRGHSSNLMDLFCLFLRRRILIKSSLFSD
jgi:hypothetical protein